MLGIQIINGYRYESTGGTLAWVIYCLAAYPEAQEELRKELTTIGVFHESLEGSNYDKLPILNAVIMEATRLYPAFTFLLRKAIRDTMIGDQIIPRGTLVGMCPEAINCAQHLWGPDAANFLPERWIDRSDPACPRPNPLGGASAPICMLSFGYGARSCVGRELALAQMKCQIAMIVQRFHVGLVDDSKPGPSGLFATSPPSDLQIHFTELHV